jgi:solute carrier family 45 protein 3
MSMILGVGPTLGFFLVPIIGRYSDQCHSRYGRRRPFIFALSMLLLAALFIIPFGGAFCRVLFGEAGGLATTAALFTMVLGAVMLDFTCQTCLTPCEALLSDLR